MGRIAAFIGESEIAPPSTTPHGRLHSIPAVVNTGQRWLKVLAEVPILRNSCVRPGATDDQRELCRNALLKRDETVTRALADRLGAVAHPELGVDRGDMELDGMFADV